MGDRHHHLHSVQNEDAALTTLSEVVQRTAVNETILDDAFTAPELAVPCSSEPKLIFLEDGYVSATVGYFR